MNRRRSDASQRRPPLVVIACSQDLRSRTLETVLGPHGFAVLRAYSGKQTLERCHDARPDGILLDLDLPDMSALEVCRRLRDDPAIRPSTPILVTSTRATTREERVAALRAGAWDFVGDALDDQELPLRLAAFVAAKFDADRAREENPLDEQTGLYNAKGLAQRARELSSIAFRNREPMACVVFSVAGAADRPDAQLAEAIRELAAALRERARQSDAAGRVGPEEFAVMALGADAAGAQRMAERLAGDLRTVGARIVAGLDAVADYREAPVDPVDLLDHATRAMHQSRSDARGDWLRRYDGTAAH